MAEKIAIANAKGGIGKTSTSVNTADALIHAGYKVLMVDLDPQGNSTSMYKAVVEDETTMYDLLKKEATAKEAIQHTAFGDIIPNETKTQNLAGEIQNQLGGFNILKKALKEVEADYDFIIMDTPPAVGIFMTLALTAADYLIVPMFPNKFSVDAVVPMRNAIADVKDNTNEKLNVLGLLLCNYDGRKNSSKFTKENLNEIADVLNTKAFETVIGTDSAVENAQNEINSLFESYPKCRAVSDYLAYVKEIIDRINQQK